MNTILDVSTLRELRCAELGAAARLLGRGMCHNPANVRAFGIRDTAGRSRALTRFFAPVLRGLSRRGLILGAFRDGTLVGVCGMARPGLCQPTALEKLNVIPSLVFGNPVGTPLRVLRWVGEWARRDPVEPHWHLGPVAVDAHLQGRGVGGIMLAAFSARMDDCRTLAYLETDRFENVRFYQKFGFKVVAEAEVLGGTQLVHVPARRNPAMTRTPVLAFHAGSRFRGTSPASNEKPVSLEMRAATE